MTTLAGWTVDWLQSPRIITIPEGVSAVTAQDQVDTVRKLEDTFRGMSEAHLLDAEGKAGGGVTGIVIVLQNAEYAFAARSTVQETGAVTTADTFGRTLIDSTALFVTNGVARGDIIINNTDGSHSTVLTVVSETELIGLPLIGGVDNRWDSADAYQIFEFTDVSLTGGDVFAVDEFDAPINPILNTFGIGTSTIEQSTSPAAAPVQPNTVLEGSITWEQAVRLILAAAAAGKLSGADTTEVTIRDVADSKDRIVATVDEFGNRSAITTLDGT